MNTGNDEEKYYSIGDVSKLTGIKPTVLRFWESEFSQLSPVKNKFGHRVYSEKEIRLIKEIKKLLYDEGLTIKGAKNLLTHRPVTKSREPKKVVSSGSYREIKEKLQGLLGLVQNRKL